MTYDIHNTNNAENIQHKNDPSDSAAQDTSSQSEGLQQQLEQTKALAAEYWDKYLRSVAELDNFRKRQEKAIVDRVLTQKKKILHSLLPVMDDIDRALAYQETLDRDTALQMLKLVATRLREVVKSEGVQVIPSVGEPFDPYLHEAIETVPSMEQPEGMVIEEALKGYTLDDETLRPARVKVSTRQDATVSPESSDTTTQE